MLRVALSSNSTLRRQCIRYQTNLSNGPLTLRGSDCTHSRGLRQIGQAYTMTPARDIPQSQDDLQLRDGLIPFHSPLLRESRLFSFPGLINMLKFGPYPCLSSGRKSWSIVMTGTAPSNSGSKSSIGDKSIDHTLKLYVAYIAAQCT